jgi:diguanylate cyclase (GGDEF)-like protein
MVDCDHFKQVNDRWGHDAGDKVLVRLVQICREKLRDLDTIFRWGGEEFLVLVPGASTAVAHTVAERLREAVAAAVIEAQRDSIKITVSIGVAEVTNSDEDSADTVRRADLAVYQAKATGRNRVVAD